METVLVELLIALALALIIAVSLWFARRRKRPTEHPLRAELRDRLKQKHPGHTEQWYLEKAEYDLTRDG